MAGPFVKKFQNYVLPLQQVVDAELIEQANQIAAEMRNRVPVKTGNLRQSIRVEIAPPQGKTLAKTIKIKAGGQLTTRLTARGRPYDYALAEEFGTHEESARPFFFTVFRARKKRALTAAADRMEVVLRSGKLSFI